MANDIDMVHAGRANVATLGPRFGTDLLAAATAAFTITPIVCLIDRYCDRDVRILLDKS